VGGALTIEGVEGGPFLTNAYLLTDAATRRCAVVDPGYGADRLWGGVIAERGLTLESILLTHGHIDHVTGLADLARAFPGVPILIHPDDAPMLGSVNVAVAAGYGLPRYEPTAPTGELSEARVVRVGEVELNVLHLPGHSPGSVGFFGGRDLISGDVLFAGSIGRTDLPGGDWATLSRSIVDKVLPLGDEVRVHPGHGPKTTIGRERAANPFVLQMLSESARGARRSD
jgi:glyoxylase-like metal-dependent hydrolase (beta-lactamase superfamily II)